VSAVAAAIGWSPFAVRRFLAKRGAAGDVDGAADDVDGS
jgi:hypothetical protein